MNEKYYIFSFQPGGFRVNQELLITLNDGINQKILSSPKSFVKALYIVSGAGPKHFYIKYDYLMALLRSIQDASKSNVSHNVKSKYEELLKQMVREYTSCGGESAGSTIESLIEYVANREIKGEFANEFIEKTESISLNFVFNSSDHLRYENDQLVSGPHGGARRAIKVEPNINKGEGYSVTLFNLDGVHPVWQNNVQMAPKQMRIQNSTNGKVVLRGYGEDLMGTSFSDYGLTIIFENEKVNKCILHMHDRNIRIEYLA